MNMIGEFKCFNNEIFQFNTNNNNNVDYLMCSTGSNRVILFNDINSRFCGIEI